MYPRPLQAASSNLVEQPPTAFMLEDTAHVGDAVRHPYTKSEVPTGISVPKILLIFAHGVNRPGDLDL